MERHPSSVSLNPGVVAGTRADDRLVRTGVIVVLGRVGRGIVNARAHLADEIVIPVGESAATGIVPPVAAKHQKLS